MWWNIVCRKQCYMLILFVISSNIGLIIVIPFFHHSTTFYFVQLFSLLLVGKGHHQKRVHCVIILLLNGFTLSSNFFFGSSLFVYCFAFQSHLSYGVVTLNPFEKIWDILIRMCPLGFGDMLQ